MILWFERWPERLQAELEALRQAGIEFEVDEDARRCGVIRLTLQATTQGDLLRLVATFPDLYPYFRFELQAPDLEALPHHLHPFAKTLCVIPRPSVYWRTSDTLARFIAERVPRALDAGRADDADEVADLEVQQAEPFSDYYQYAPGPIVIVDSAWAIPPDERAGTFEIGLLSPIHAGIVRGVILRMRSDEGRELVRTPEESASLTTQVVTGRWCRAEAPLSINDAKSFFEELERRDPDKRVPPARKIGDVSVQVRAVLFPEEVGWRTVGAGWVFAVRARKQGTGKRRRPAQYYLVRAGRGGRDDWAARAPSLRGLRDHTIALCGLGAVGAPLALELARAGVGKLRLLDYDHVDPGSSVRWPLGLAAAGFPKTHALKSAIRAHYPHTQVEEFLHRLGAVRDPGAEGASDLEVIEAFTNGASLILDASAELGIQHLLSDRARELGIPYVSVTATPGGWGGLIIRIRPRLTEGCWMCAQHALHPDVQQIPAPPADPAGGVQPPGCADPTFVGTGLDIGTVAIAGARAVAATLCRDVPRGYPDGDWDVTVIRLRTDEGEWTAPHFHEYRLQNRSMGCRNCTPQRLWLPKSLFDELAGEADTLAPRETGGTLLGYQIGPDVVITDATGPGPRARHGPDRYIPDHDHDVGAIARLYEASGRRLRYFGDWHTHPGSGAYLSRRDRATLRRIARTAGARAPTPIMLVISRGEAWNAHAWNARLEQRRLLRPRLVCTEMRVVVFSEEAAKA